MPHGLSTSYAPDVDSYAALSVAVATARLELRGASDDLLEALVPLVRAGQADATPPPFDDPISFYDEDPDVRVHQWLRANWRARGSLEPDLWRLGLVVVVGGRPVGMQDVIGNGFATFGTVTTFSWLAADSRGRGLGLEARHAALHLAFDGFGAAEASSDAFIDNVASNRVSERLGYQRNGTEWATRRGEPALLQRWRLTRDQWLKGRRDDITLSGVEACRELFHQPHEALRRPAASARGGTDRS